MSQYTMSLKSIIDIKTRSAHYADTRGRVEAGRDIFFPFSYTGANDETFKKLFETGFILWYLDENICYEDLEKWYMIFQNEVETKAPLFYARYEKLKALIESDIKELGTDETERIYSEENSGTHAENDERRGHGYSKNSSDTVSRVIGSQFPYDIAGAEDIGTVKHADSGSMSDNESDIQSFSDSTERGNRSGENAGEKSGTDKITHKQSGNILDRIEKYNAQQRDVITEFIKSFNHLFVMIW